MTLLSRAPYSQAVILKEKKKLQTKIRQAEQISRACRKEIVVNSPVKYRGTSDGEFHHLQQGRTKTPNISTVFATLRSSSTEF